MRGPATTEASTAGVSVPPNMTALLTKVLTNSDAKEYRIVLPKLVCEQVLVEENQKASTSRGRDCILRVWGGSQSVLDTPAAAQVAPAGAAALTTAPTAASAQADVSARFWSFRYRISPCGKSFIHSMHDQEGFFSSIGVVEGDQVTLCRWKVDNRLALIVRRLSLVPREPAPIAPAKQPRQPPQPAGAHQPDVQKRRRLATAHYAPEGLPPIGMGGIAFRVRSPPPKRALTLFPNARIRVGNAFQAAVPLSVVAASEAAPDGLGSAVASPIAPISAVPSAEDELFVDWPDGKHTDFALALSAYGKDMSAISRALGISTQAAVAYYYYHKAHATVCVGRVPSYVTEAQPRC